MIKKLTRHGNSLALVIDKPILELLKIDENTPLEIRPDGRGLHIEPAGDTQRQARFEQAVQDVNAQWSAVFKKLAE